MAVKQKCECGCGKAVPRTRRGRQARFASNACRQRAYRRKIRAILEQCKFAVPVIGAREMEMQP